MVANIWTVSVGKCKLQKLDRQRTSAAVPLASEIRQRALLGRALGIIELLLRDNQSVVCNHAQINPTNVFKYYAK
jgi:hypothetical protein